VLVASVGGFAIYAAQRSQVAQLEQSKARLEQSQAQSQHLQAIYNQITADAAQLEITQPTIAGQLALVAYNHDQSPDSTSLLYAAASITLSNPLTGHTGRVWKVAFSRTGSILAVGSSDTIHLWNVTDPAHPALVGHPLSGPASGAGGLAFSPDGHILAASSGHTIQRWNLTNTAHITAIEPPLPDPHIGDISTLAFSLGGSRLTAGGSGGTAAWNFADPARPPKGHPQISSSPGVSEDVVVSPGGLPFGVVGNMVFLATGGQKPPTLTSSTTINAVAFSRDGSILAAGSGNGTIQLWNIADLSRSTKIGTFTADTVNSLDFSPDGKRLVVGSQDGTVRLWDVSHPAYATAIGLPISDASPVLSVAYSPDGNTLAVGSSDGTARLWNVNVPHVINQICATGNITPRQWAAYIPQLPYDPPCRHHP
jgi:WD40 repeat protein